MRIALIILHADPARGGAERYTVDLAAALVARGHDVALVASSFAGTTPGRAIQIKASGPTRTSRYRRFLQGVDAHLREARYDITHAMLPVLACDVYHPHAGLAAESISTGHLKHASVLKQTMAKFANRLTPRRMAFAKTERSLLARANPPVVLCLSEYIKASVRRHYPLPEEKLATLFNAVDLAKFDPAARPEAGGELRNRLGIPTDRTLALIIAQDFERKGLGEAIRAIAKANEPNLGLLIVGKEDPAAYRKLAADLSVADRVTFAGPTKDPYACYQTADFFVLPTRHDPCSLVVLESLAMTVPVISTRFNGACEIMTPGTHGYVLPDPGDIDALAAAMRNLADSATREAMRAACAELRPVLAYERHVETLEAAYADTIRRRT